MNEKQNEGGNPFSQLFNQFTQSNELPGQAQLRTLMQSALNKMELVSRDEFDAQAAVLARTRALVEALEQRVAELEAATTPPAPDPQHASTSQPDP